ncbi:acetate--CoA ligase family protein [Oryzicola mucosus]|uniref:Acetate--CoA ligase family protein n=1 Tax=Oryzicola mucosus TaxID=2767425 RepID=A0A8J6U5Q7_9HYPH|nr:acetate--CoA ligase family protein [Oryzicola mucosus]MBD0416740.1 acetate--CoA ligase family protein [Oryzicola mucosus]
MQPLDLPDSRLDQLFNPRSVAVVGASDDPVRISGRPLAYLKAYGFAGTIYPINPKRQTVQGLKAYPSLLDPPEIPDVAIIAVSAQHVLQAVSDAGKKGVASAIIMSSGFAEAGGDGVALQRELVRLGKQGGVRLIGPNCVGLFSASSRFYGTFTQSLDGGVPPAGGVAVVSQSGAYGGYIAYLARERGLGLNYWITTGNEADVDAAEAIAWLALRDDVQVIAVYLEGVRNGPAFMRALATARAARKPVVVMKVGRSAAGAIAASSHTASLAGTDAVYDAVFREYGAFRARTTEEQLDIAEACLAGKFPVSNRLGIVTLSGGVGVQMCDAAETYGLDVAPMPKPAQEKLRALLPYAAVANPIDTTAQVMNDMSLVAKNLEIVLRDGGYDSLVSFLTTVPAAKAYGTKLRDAILAGVAAAGGDRLAVLCMAAPPDAVKSYRDAGFLVYQDADRAVQVVGALTHFGRSFEVKTGLSVAGTAPRFEPNSGTLSEHVAKAVLGEAGVPFLQERLASDRTAAVAAASEIGFPVAMKIVSAEIQHKSDIGGVVLNIKDTSAAGTAFDTIMDNVRGHMPHADIDGVLVAPMAPQGVETIVGVMRDPVFGPVVMFGLGGVLVEVLKDVTFSIAPFDETEAMAMIRRIKGYTVLEGVRGAGRYDIEALAKVLAAVSRFAALNSDTIESLDLNPLRILSGKGGAIALDAVIVPRF